MPWLPEAHERIQPEPVALLDRIVRRIRFPAIIARRWYVCPACARVRRDPTTNCPRCHL